MKNLLNKRKTIQLAHLVLIMCQLFLFNNTHAKEVLPVKLPKNDTKSDKIQYVEPLDPHPHDAILQKEEDLEIPNLFVNYAYSDTLMGILQDGYEYISKRIDEYQLKNEMTFFTDYVSGDAWIRTAENGSSEKLMNELAEALDPVVGKLLNTDGKSLVQEMPIELLEWLRSSTILWIKNKGKGSIATKQQIDLENVIQQKDIEIQKLKTELEQTKKTKMLYYKNLNHQYLQALEENDNLQLQIVDQAEELNNNKISFEENLENQNIKHQQEVQEMGKRMISECKQSKDQLLKALNSKFSESVKKQHEIFKKEIQDNLEKEKELLKQDLNVQCIQRMQTQQKQVQLKTQQECQNKSRKEQMKMKQNFTQKLSDDLAEQTRKLTQLCEKSMQNEIDKVQSEMEWRIQMEQRKTRMAKSIDGGIRFDIKLQDDPDHNPRYNKSHKYFISSQWQNYHGENYMDLNRKSYTFRWKNGKYVMNEFNKEEMCSSL